MINLIKRLFGKRSKQPLFVPIATRGWAKADCDACQAGSVISFNWEHARSEKQIGDRSTAVDISAFKVDRRLRAGVLFCCDRCGSHWYLDPDGLMMNSVKAERVPLLLRWSEHRLTLNDDLENVLRQIGRTPSDIYGNGASFESYPCAVHTHSGDFIPTAIVSKQRHAPFEDWREYRLGSEIASIKPSDNALSLEVRTATSRADEISMGFAPTILETEDGQKLTANWTTNFLKMDGIDPSTVRMSTDQSYFSDRPPMIDSPKPVYFIVDS